MPVNNLKDIFPDLQDESNQGSYITIHTNFIEFCEKNKELCEWLRQHEQTDIRIYIDKMKSIYFNYETHEDKIRFTVQDDTKVYYTTDF